jgi:cytochrome c peroxidase
MFWDGRVEGNATNGYENPAGDDLPDGLVNALAVQAMFPVTSRDEMRGDRGDDDIFGVETELGWIKDVNPEGMWDALTVRLLKIPAYQILFRRAYPEVETKDLGFEHAANAIAAYESAAFSAIDTPWDRYLDGELDAISAGSKSGALLFYGEAGCSECHSGDHFTDWDFHNLVIPHIGPGKEPESPLDYGRARVTGDDCDLFAFRTPPLRNVSLTGPWMHNGAYTTLEAAVRHHLDPVASLQNYDPSQLSPELVNLTTVLGPDDTILLTCGTARTEVIELTEAQVGTLLHFLDALTSPTSINAAHLVPDSVPSGLPVGGQ